MSHYDGFHTWTMWLMVLPGQLWQFIPLELVPWVSNQCCASIPLWGCTFDGLLPSVMGLEAAGVRVLFEFFLLPLSLCASLEGVDELLSNIVSFSQISSS